MWFHFTVLKIVKDFKEVGGSYDRCAPKPHMDARELPATARGRRLSSSSVVFYYFALLISSSQVQERNQRIHSSSQKTSLTIVKEIKVILKARLDPLARAQRLARPGSSVLSTWFRLFG
ncbi:hypothetical protein ISN45_At03g029340 [Arabidopsis thaliana x Arabidopsis arenosa]|uniref:Uncharacterized protein n=2 Tax=Arabidopsis TaxID=3701 RepID=A0A5S9XGA1_ARATH|nr:hypothetical protein ISN45_At03g029340 [Arabidopsis thaliana x Arabidopsis arenosa]CAA0383904.1 unnamed protein product [Arabidopsis thaliana]